MRVQGSVKFFNEARGFGFIKQDDDQENDIFLHVTQLNAGKIGDVVEGDKLSFEIEATAKGSRAVNIQRVTS